MSSPREKLADRHLRRVKALGTLAICDTREGAVSLTYQGDERFTLTRLGLTDAAPGPGLRAGGARGALPELTRNRPRIIFFILTVF
jgi:hypothetical protein